MQIDSAMERAAMEYGKHYVVPTPSSFVGLSAEQLTTKEAQLKHRIKSLTPTFKLLQSEAKQLEKELSKLYNELHKVQQEVVPVQRVSVSTKAEERAMLQAIAQMSPEELAKLMEGVS